MKWDRLRQIQVAVYPWATRGGSLSLPVSRYWMHLRIYAQQWSLVLFDKEVQVGESQGGRQDDWRKWIDERHAKMAYFAARDGWMEPNNLLKPLMPAMIFLHELPKEEEDTSQRYEWRHQGKKTHILTVYSTCSAPPWPSSWQYPRWMGVWYLPWWMDDLWVDGVG